MIFMPSLEIQNRLLAEPAGVWVDRSGNEPHLWLVAKLPQNLIREIDVGAKITLSAWVVQIDAELFTAFGFLIYDDPDQPMAICNVCHSTDDVIAFRDMLKQGAFPLQIHNEIGIQLLHVACRIDSSSATGLIAAISTDNHPAGDGIALRRRAQDIIEASQKPGTIPDPSIKASCSLPITIEKKVKLEVLVMPSETFSLTDTRQGRELELLTFQQLDTLFPFGTFHSPERDHTKGRLEVCDVLAVSRIRLSDEEGIFVIQNKVSPALESGLQRSTFRRKNSIQKNIIKGITQTVGAINRIKAGTQLYKNTGEPIEKDQPEVASIVEPLNLRERANKVGNGIVLISEMQGGVDWKLVWKEMFKACQKTNYCFHVLDLLELQQLILHSNGKPSVFEALLLVRFTRMAKEETAAVRFEYKD